MKARLLIGAMLSVFAVNAAAVTAAEDVATTITLRGFACGNKASEVKETLDAQGNKTIQATCPNGRRYLIQVSTDGKVTVTPR